MLSRSPRSPSLSSPVSEDEPPDASSPSDGVDGVSAVPPGHRLHLVCLNPQVQWLLLHTCLPVHELRGVLAPFTDVLNRCDFDVQCEAARLASQHAGAAWALQGALDRRHQAAVQRSSRAASEEDLLALWEEAVRSGNLPGACWAIASHRRATPRLRQLLARDVHRLQRVDARLEQAHALELENAELRQRLVHQQGLLHRAAVQREQDVAERSALRLQVSAIDESWRMSATLLEATKDARQRAESLSSALMFQVARREQAESAAMAAQSNALRMELELEHFKSTFTELGRELVAMEEQVRGWMQGGSPVLTPLSGLIQGRKVLYVGGRPSSSAAIRFLVDMHGGEYRRHEGRVEERMDLLAEALSWADLVVAPLDDLTRKPRRHCSGSA